MRGHWESQTRKLNKHYQSAGGDKTWDGDGYIVPVDCVFAPFYGVFSANNGAPLFKTDITRLSFSQSVDPKIEIAKVNVDVRPYIPRIYDDYYYWDSEWGSQQELQWVAGQNGCKIRYYDYVDENQQHIGYRDIMTIPAGTNFGQQRFDLIKPEYDFYVVRGLYSNVGSGYNLKTVYDSLSTGKLKYNIKVRHFTGNLYYYDVLGFERGLFGDYVRGGYHYIPAGMFMEYFNPYSFVDYDKFLTGGTPPAWYYDPNPDYAFGFSGLQQPEIWSTGPVNKYSPYYECSLPGFIYPNNMSTRMVANYDTTDNYRYSTLWILKKLTKINSTITG